MPVISNRFTSKNIIIGVLVILILAGLFGSFYTIEEGDRGVVLRNGELIDVASPGLHFKVPFIDTVHAMTIRTQYISRKIQVYSKDAQPVEVIISTNYHINNTGVKEIYSNYGLEYRNNIIVPQLLTVPEVVFGAFTAVNIVSMRESLTRNILNRFIEHFNNTNIIIESIQIENVDFSDEYERAVEARMTAEVEVEKVTKNAEKEKQTALITKTKSEAAAYAFKQDADAKAHSAKVMGEAEAYAIEVKSQALAKQPNYVDLIKAERWNGILPTTMIPNNSIPIIGK